MATARIKGLVKAVHGVVHLRLAGHDRKYVARAAAAAAPSGDPVAAIFGDGKGPRMLVDNLEAMKETPIEVGGEL